MRTEIKLTRDTYWWTSSFANPYLCGEVVARKVSIPKRVSTIYLVLSSDRPEHQDYFDLALLGILYIPDIKIDGRKVDTLVVFRDAINDFGGSCYGWIEYDE